VAHEGLNPARLVVLNSSHRSRLVSDSDYAREQINRHLHDAIDVLRKDVWRVEIWADALRGFTMPVPTYEMDRRFDLKPKKDT